MSLTAQQFSHLKVLIIGDVMVDSYIKGKIDRISPEAPVPVVSVTNREERLGGAANVALNVIAMGATPILCSVIGNDKMGDTFINLLNQHQIVSKHIIVSNHRPTTVKHRVMAGNHHVLRIDEETDVEIQPDIASTFVNLIRDLIPECDVIVLEDYDKGVLTTDTIRFIKSEAKKNKIAVVVDPKKRNFNSYTETDLFKPNLKELQEGINEKIDTSDLENIKKGVRKLHQKMNCHGVMVTLSEKGIFSIFGEEEIYQPAHYREISDVSGAGDTVVSVAAIALAAKLPPASITKLANLAGGLVCEHHGVVPIDLKQLIEEFNSL